MTALIITQGPARRRRALRRLAAQADLVVVADGGARAARAAGIVPDLLVGDLDSLDDASARWASRRSIRGRVFPPEKNATDAELALRLAVQRGAREIVIFGPLSGRMDQALANVFLVVAARALGSRARLTDGRAFVWLASRTTRIDGRRGDLVSLLPLSPRVRGIVTTGLRYPLNQGTLRQGFTRGISNEIVSLPASVRVAKGDLLLIHTPKRLRD